MFETRKGSRWKRATQVTMHKLQGNRSMPRGTFVKTILMMFFEYTTRTNNHPCKIPSEDQSPYCLYIVVAMSDNLSDWIAHAKFCSSYHYEKQKLKKKVWPKIVKFVQPSNIINSSSSKDILRIFKILDYNLVRCKRHSFTFTWMSNLIDW